MTYSTSDSVIRRASPRDRAETDELTKASGRLICMRSITQRIAGRQWIASRIPRAAEGVRASYEISSFANSGRGKDALFPDTARRIPVSYNIRSCYVHWSRVHRTSIHCGPVGYTRRDCSWQSVGSFSRSLDQDGVPRSWPQSNSPFPRLALRASAVRSRQIAPHDVARALRASVNAGPARSSRSTNVSKRLRPAGSAGTGRSCLITPPRSPTPPVCASSRSRCSGR